ncbi:MAG: metal-dependent transcriptional regulator [Armatimonadetes bacterium]|nr:metal-dependent transcriptional regulator [Armatimonadota bacterium]
MPNRDPMTLRVPASCRPGHQDKSSRLFTESVEEYVEGVFRLQKEMDKVTTGEIATYMIVSPASASNMMKKLAGLGLVNHVPYKGIKLTKHGEKMARQMTRAHRVIERFLVDELELPWNDVHELACKLEHYINDDIIERIEKRLGYPTTCPHGNPIDADAPDPSVRLEKASAGKLCVYRISDERKEFLEHLEQIGLKPGVKFEAVSSTKIDRLIHLKVAGKKVTVGAEVARHVWVVPA